MGEETYEVTDRRPIAARRLAVMSRAATALARAGVTANSISIAGMVCGIFAGFTAWGTPRTGPIVERILWLATAAFVQLRLLANLLDGMVAIESRTASKYGELFNEAPDRVSDAATLIGVGYAAGSIPLLGWTAAILAILTAYVRLTGKAAGAGTDFRGPMAKQHRMFLVTVLSILGVVTPDLLQHWRAAVVCLAIICAGCVVTIRRRLTHIAAILRSKS